MGVFDELARIAELEEPGPMLSFSRFHVAKALFILGRGKAVGRNLLAQQLGIGPGAVRTLLRRLKEERLITTRRAGCSLTKKGQKLYNELRSRIPVFTLIRPGKIAAAPHCAVAVVRNTARSVSDGLAQRDAAIRAGGLGATTIIYEKGDFFMPPEKKPCSKKYPDPIWSQLESLGLQNGDIIILASANSDEKAELATLSAAWTLA